MDHCKLQSSSYFGEYLRFVCRDDRYIWEQSSEKLEFRIMEGILRCREDRQKRQYCMNLG